MGDLNKNGVPFGVSLQIKHGKGEITMLRQKDEGGKNGKTILHCFKCNDDVEPIYFSDYKRCPQCHSILYNMYALFVTATKTEE